MKKMFLLMLAFTLILTGCSKSKSLASADFDPFYLDFREAISTAELKSRDTLNNQEILKTYISDYSTYSEELIRVSKHLNDLTINTEEGSARALKKAATYLENLSQEFQSEIKYVSKLNCPLTWNDSMRKIIEECGRTNLRWGYAVDRATICTYYLASTELSLISEFDFKKVTITGKYSEKDLNSCNLFKNSNSIYGHPQITGVTWIPEKFQNKYLKDDQMFVVEIADGLYTESTGDLLTDALYGSWNGSCAVYKRYERLLGENGFLLGSIKSGTCY